MILSSDNYIHCIIQVSMYMYMYVHVQQSFYDLPPLVLKTRHWPPVALPFA